MSTQQLAIYSAIAAVFISSILLFSKQWLSNLFSPRYAQSIKKEIRIQKLFIHPIKSCRGTSVPEAYFDEGGLRYDRSWLIIDGQTKKFQTARELPKMVVISPRMDLANNSLEITIPLPEKGDVLVKTPLDPSKEQLSEMEIVKGIIIWGEEADGYAVSKEADEALSQFFERPVQLVRKGPGLRNAGPDDPRKEKSVMHFQDFYPILIASKASIQHVRDTLVASIYPNLRSSTKYDQALPANHAGVVQAFKVSDKISKDRWTPEALESFPIERFRPNIVVESFNDDHGRDLNKALVPWEEDAWTHIEVFDGRTSAASGKEAGGIGFGSSINGKGTSIDCVARCGRCLVPNVDPQQGVRDSYVPYTILQRFRQVQPEYAKKGKPCFGVLASPAQPSGLLKVGDIVRVTSVMDPQKRKLGK
ncbi:uncharacterized protein FA14DRAFT_164653 [Meira miltonrushii]|uniref:MOSC domain-containing protein n=1 Tax=Meira miltonrushii TaxID=1280837 RepID=A0A316VEW0_9BASI|nr:uncharacterized protein FA14DRAFT_164653 [Meira miltonrushii]PWN36122.1 hypothetical protein FA14DRAFT_164653 [Meira miltonrushii]